MAIRAVVLELDDERWAGFVRSCPDALPFHHAAWGSLVAECYGHRAIALALLDSEGVVAGSPAIEIRNRFTGRKRWVSLPFTDHCPPLARDSRGLDALFAALDDLRRDAGVSTLEIRSELPLPGLSDEPHAYLHTIDLTIGKDALFQSFDRSQVQRSIRRSVRDGVLLRRGEREQDVTHTYHGLHVDTRRRHGIPTQPRRFFQLVWKRLLEPGLGFLSLAYTGGEPVAGAIFLIDGGHTISYKYAASDPRFWGVRPNHAVIWDGISWGCENGFRQFDFGVTHLPDESLRAFKSRWAAREQTVVDARLGDRRRARHAMPAAARQGASLVIRHGPRWVCRGLGAALYRYAA